MLICAGKCHDIPESRGLLPASSFRVNEASKDPFDEAPRAQALSLPFS